MNNKTMSTLNIGNNSYEIKDAFARQKIAEMDNTTTEMEDKMEDYQSALIALNGRKDILYNMLPVDTASGAVASFSDGADDIPLKSLVVGIEPVQSGNGDPSPDNVRPITGWTGVNITTCGKNVLMNTARAHTSNSVTYDVNADGSITANGTAAGGNGRCDIININNPSKSLLDAFSGKKLSGCPEGGAYNTYLVQLIINGAVVCRDYGNGVQIPDLSQYYGAGNLYIDASVRTNYVAENLVFKPMISEDATYGAYEPYSGESIAVTFPSEAGTVYGGVLDVLTGVLTVDRVKETFVFDNPTEDSTYNLESQKFNLTKRSTGSSNSTGKITNVCGAYAYAQANWNNGKPHFYVGTASCTLYLTKNTYRGGNVELCYPLETPLTYQLTPTEVNSLLGSNNIYADTGDTTVEYRADIQQYVNDTGAVTAESIANALGYTPANPSSIPTVTNDFTDAYKNKVDALWSDYQSAMTAMGL